MRGKRCPVLKYQELAKRTETVIREGDYCIIRSPRRVKGCLAFVVLRKQVSWKIRNFKALAAQASSSFRRAGTTCDERKRSGSVAGGRYCEVMKIGIDARFYGPAGRGGLGRYTAELIRALEMLDSENDCVIFAP